MVFIKNDYVLFLGRIVPEKGVHYLIEAFSKLNTNKSLSSQEALPTPTSIISIFSSWLIRILVLF